MSFFYFFIFSSETTDALPQSSTCSSTLYLPNYPRYSTVLSSCHLYETVLGNNCIFISTVLILFVLCTTCSAEICEEKLRYAAYNCVAIDTDMSPWEE